MVCVRVDTDIIASFIYIELTPVTIGQLTILKITIFHKNLDNLLFTTMEEQRTNKFNVSFYVILQFNTVYPGIRM